VKRKHIKFTSYYLPVPNYYDSTNEAEFFSVISEYFFQQPHLLEKNHPPNEHGTLCEMRRVPCCIAMTNHLIPTRRIGSNPGAANTNTSAIGHRETFGRVKGAASDGKAGAGTWRDGFERTAGRLQAKGGQFTIPHDDNQLVASTGVFAHHVATFPYSTLSINAIKLNVGSGQWISVHLNG